MSVSICLLAYKEEENLKFLLPKIISNIEKVEKNYEILVIDGEKSLDNTKELCSKYLKCKYINQEYHHFGGAMKTGIKYASKDYFLILDADGSHDPIYIPDLVKEIKINKSDVVIGSRYVKGGINSDSKINIIMSKILNFCYRFALGIKAKDISTDYRIYKTKQLKKIELNSDYYNVVQEILIKLKVKNENFSIEEIPITFRKRYYGNSKRNLFKFIIEYIRHLFSFYIFRLKNEKKYLPNVLNIVSGFIIFTILFFSFSLTKAIPIFLVSLVASLLSYLFCVFVKLFFINDVKYDSKKYYIVGNIISSILISVSNGIFGYTISCISSIGLTYVVVLLVCLPILLLCTYDFRRERIEKSSKKYSNFFTFRLSKNAIIFTVFTIVYATLVLGGCIYNSIDSDFANITLEANDIIHGNPFLTGWTQTGISFICTDLFAFEFFTLLFGVSKYVTAFATWFMIMLVYFITFLLIKSLTDNRKKINFLIIFILLCFIPNFSTLAALRAHTMVTFYSLTIIFLIDKMLKKNKINRSILLVIALVIFSTMSDSTYIPFYFAPILLFLGVSLLYKKSYNFNNKLNFLIIVILCSSLGLGFLCKTLFYKIGGANPGEFGRVAFVHPNEWFNNLKNVLSGFYSISGGTNNFINGWQALNNIFIIILLSFSLIFAACNIFYFLTNKNKSIINFCISISPFIMLLVLTVTKLYVSKECLRYYQSYNFINAIIIINFICNFRFAHNKNKIVYTLIASAFCVLSTFNCSEYKNIYRSKPAFQDAIAETITRYDLKSGFSSFWIASETTVTSNNRCSLRTMINYDATSFCLYNHFLNIEWYNNYFNYVITDDIYKSQGLDINKDKVINVFGNPMQDIKIDIGNESDVHLFIYDYDISKKVKGCPHYIG